MAVPSIPKVWFGDKGIANEKSRHGEDIEVPYNIPKEF